MTIPSEAELTTAIMDATRAAVRELYSAHPGQHFYYCSLITTEDALAPFLSAWSEEAFLESLAGESPTSPDAIDTKWSYVDSPFCFFGEALFEPVRQLFAARPGYAIERRHEWADERTLRFNAMEAAMAALDAEGLFGDEAAREGIVINVEVMPPNHTNTQRALRLNRRSNPVLQAWLAEIAEPIP